MNTLLGGTEVTVQFNDGSFAAVKVKQVPVKDMQAFLLAQDDELKMIAVAVETSAGFNAENLNPESHELLIGTIEKVNNDFFSRWVARQIARKERLLPGSTKVAPSV